MFDLNRLRLLRELHHQGTIRAVAATLHYSPSTVSQQLSVLESEAGVPLLETVGRGVRLTPQGELLVAHTDAVLQRLEAAQAELAGSVEEVTGTMRIAGFQSVLLSVLPAVLTDLAADHPGLRVELVQAEPETALPQLVSHGLDLVIAEEYPGQPLARPEEVRYRGLGEDVLRFAIPRRVAAEAGVLAGDAPVDGDVVWELVRRQPWVAEPEGAASRRWLVDLCRSAGFEPDIRYQTNDLLVHRRMVALGHAVAVLPGLVTDESPAGTDPTVVEVDIPDGPHRRRLVTACRRSTVDRPAVRACQEALQRHTRDGSAAR